MEINLNDFSKGALVGILAATRDKNLIPDAVLASLQRIDLIRRVMEIQKKHDDMIGPLKAQGAKLTVRSSKKQYLAYNKRVGQYNRLGKKGAELVGKIQVLDKAFPELKEKESEPCQET